MIIVALILVSLVVLTAWDGANPHDRKP